MKKNRIPRVGIGFDSHVFSHQGTLMLGGLRIPKMAALKGHSDGDAVLHAVIDALLGAASLGDIGDHFPDSSQKLKGVSSALLLKKILKLISKKGFLPVHVDITIVANKPRFTPIKLKMRKQLSRMIGLPVENVSIKAKTLEGLNWFKPQEGIAVWAVASMI